MYTTSTPQLRFWGDIFLQELRKQHNDPVAPLPCSSISKSFSSVIRWANESYGMCQGHAHAEAEISLTLRSWVLGCCTPALYSFSMMIQLHVIPHPWLRRVLRKPIARSSGATGPKKRFIVMSSTWFKSFVPLHTFSLPTRHILTLGQDPLASLFDAQGTPLASLFNVQGSPLFSFACLNLMVWMHLYKIEIIVYIIIIYFL